MPASELLRARPAAFPRAMAQPLRSREQKAALRVVDCLGRPEGAEMSDMAQDATYTREYFEILDELDGDIDGRRQAAAYMASSTAIVHHRVVASSFVPRLFGPREYESMKTAA